MPQTVNPISPTTTTTTVTGFGNPMIVEIKTKYDLIGDSPLLPHIIFVEVKPSEQITQGVHFNEGDLMVQAKFWPVHVQAHLDSAKHLILTTSGNENPYVYVGDANKYSIDADGHLIYNRQIDFLLLQSGDRLLLQNGGKLIINS